MIQVPLFEPSISTTLFYLFCFFGCVQLFFLFFFFSRLPFFKQRKVEETFEYPSVSVIICGRNEADNWMENLQSILEQDYPNFEVIVVNHASSDESAEVLFAFQQEYRHLHCITVNRGTHTRYGKKFPLSIGIKAAKNNYLILTDADCKPASNQWLKRMAEHYSNEEKQIVLGFSPMIKHRGFLNWFSRMETNYIAVTYFNFAMAHFPYMSVGRNFSYTKKLFMENKGFKTHYSVMSGDDDLFLQEVATKKNISIELRPDSWCYSEAKNTWRDWLIQKKRHYSASPKYRFINKLLLGSYSSSWIFFLLFFVILLFDMEYAVFSLILFSSLLLVKWILFVFNFSKLRAAKMSCFFPLWETIYLLLTPFVYFIDIHSKSRWK